MTDQPRCTSDTLDECACQEPPPRWCWCREGLAEYSPVPAHPHSPSGIGCPKRRVAWSVRADGGRGLWSVVRPDGSTVMTDTSWRAAQDWAVNRAHA